MSMICVVPMIMADKDFLQMKQRIRDCGKGEETVLV